MRRTATPVFDTCSLIIDIELRPHPVTDTFAAQASSRVGGQPAAHQDRYAQARVALDRHATYIVAASPRGSTIERAVPHGGWPTARTRSPG
jgi:hypothetical protein